MERNPQYHLPQNEYSCDLQTHSKVNAAFVQAAATSAVLWY